MIRKASVKGQFYPDNSTEFDQFVKEWSEESSTHPSDFTPKAALVPHAGYVYSGKIAYKALNAMKLSEFKRVVIIGPSHKFSFHGVSVFNGERYESINADVAVDQAFSNQLIDDLSLSYQEEAHHEHSTEVQVPIIQFLAPSTSIVEIVYGTQCNRELHTLVDYLLNCDNTAVIISSDLSHYYSEDEAHELDQHIIDAVRELDMPKLDKGEACGIGGIAAIIRKSEDRKWKSHIVSYGTSADVKDGSPKKVVGYLSALFGN